MINRYWHTLRHLRARQIYGRLCFRLSKPQIDASPPPLLRKPTGQWLAGACRKPSVVAPGEFVFLNRLGTLTELGWNGPGRDKLWRYNQHYFDDLNAQGAARRGPWHAALLMDWVRNNPPGQDVGWEPYPTSLRIVNWIKWALAGGELPRACHESLAVQTRWLTKRLEWHLLGNHLFANAKALVFAGLWFDGAEAQGWLNKGLSILAREVPEQILSDGGQFELSPMYHALALEDMLDLVNAARRYSNSFTRAQARQVDDWASQVPAMWHWYSTMCHPDGEIAFFNDAAMGIAPPRDQLADYAGRLGFNPTTEDVSFIWLKESGYGRASAGRAVLFVDMARVGPDYLPGHAHADTLSFELSLYGRRVLVNSGTSVYGTGPERQRQRGTAAHNTVVVENRNSSDVWSGFRVGRRAYPRNPRVAREGDTLVTEATHDGYSHLSGRPVHHRCWRLSEHNLFIEDNVTAPVRFANARYHLHPDVSIQQVAAGSGTLHLPGGQIASWAAEGSAVTLEPATWHPEFGISLQTTCIDISFKDGRSKLTLTWH